MIKIKIIPDFINQNALSLNPDLLERINIQYLRKSFIRFGLLAHEIKVYSSPELEFDEVLLSQDIIDKLKLPLFVQYELMFNDNELVVGPYIGILATKKSEDLETIINNLSNYVYDYQRIGGAIVAFATDGINLKNEFITGYLYDPVEEKWIKGLYAYPGVIFKRVGMGLNLRNHLHSRLGNKIFNDYIFNKHEMHLWLSAFPDLKEHLPETILYSNYQDIKWFLNEYEIAYLKPIFGSQGLGVIKIMRIGNRIKISYLNNGETQEVLFNKHKEVKKFLKEFIKPDKYLIQQALDLISDNERLVDFRMLVLKNEFGLWEDIGLIARYGVTGSIVSNVSTGGSAEMGEVALKKVLKQDDTVVSKIRRQLSKIAINAAEKIEKCGINCGNLGVDLAVDKQGRIWIIEINNKDPNHTIAIDAKNRQMFYRAKLKTMLYAKKLSGFIEEL